MAPPQLNIRTRGASINKPSDCKTFNKKNKYYVNSFNKALAHI